MQKGSKSGGGQGSPDRAAEEQATTRGERGFERASWAEILYVHCLRFLSGPFYIVALISFRSAVLRHAHRMRLLYVHRVRTSLPETVSEEDREKFECVVTISPTGKATLSTTFTAAIDAALARLKALPS